MEAMKQTMKNPVTCNIDDTALIFEGGGMRASYTAGVLVTLLEEGLYFDHVYGISAGASHAVNYLSRDIERSKASFVDLVTYPHFGGLKTFIQGKGYFNASYIYEGLIEQFDNSDDPMSFDWDMFCANPADLHIEAIDWDTGETVAWTKNDIHSPRDLGLKVRASSTMPIFMPPTEIDGHTYMDGGMGTSWGILLDAARADGFEKFFIVRTQEKSYRKKPVGMMGIILKLAFRKHPVIAERTIERWQHYNDLLDEIEMLEEQGKAYVFYPEVMSISNKETDHTKLQESYRRGYSQSQQEKDAWKRFLFE